MRCHAQTRAFAADLGTRFDQSPNFVGTSSCAPQLEENHRNIERKQRTPEGSSCCFESRAPAPMLLIVPPWPPMCSPPSQRDRAGCGRAVKRNGNRMMRFEVDELSSSCKISLGRRNDSPSISG
jgi:hypothetical protein